MASNKNTEIVTFLYDIVGNAPFGIATIALNGTISMVNEQACKMLGDDTAPNDFIDQSYTEFLDFSPAAVKQIANGLQKTREAFDLDNLPVADNFISLKARITVQGYLIILDDTTAQRMAMDVLAKSRAELEAEVTARTKELGAALTQQKSTLESMHDGLIVIDTQGTIQTFNTAATKLFGYSVDEAIGQNIKCLMPDPYQSEHDGYLRHHLETGERKIIGTGREVEGLRKDGTIFPMDLSISPMEVNGEPYFTGLIRDITERKEIDLQLKRTNAELGQFAYVASHDLQEPLRMVSSYLQLLERKYAGELDEQAGKYIHYAVDGAARMKTLIQDLLEFSRLGRDDLVFKKVDLEPLFSAFQTDFSLAIEESQTRISHKALPDVYGDARMIRSLFQNIISNGIKYRGDKPPHIQVTSKRQGKFWAFSISDNGIGIEPEYFDKIFGVFQRLHGKGEYEGTGIGLAVCKKIVESHRVTISVESTPGEGSTFHFTLPAKQIVGS